MQTLYSSTFISIVLAFLMFLGYNNQPIDVIQNPEPLHFSNIIRQTQLTSSQAVRIEIFDDLICKSCTEFMQKTLPKIRALEQETDDIDLHLYFIPNSNDELYLKSALSLKCAADQDQFWNMHAKLHQKKDELNLANLAKELELDLETFRTCMEEKTHQESIEEDLRYASEKNITLKPTILINDYKLIGNQPFENIQKVINKILKEKETAFDDGQINEPTDLDLEIKTSSKE